MEAIMNAKHVYQVVVKALKDAQSNASTHIMLSFDRRNTKILVEESQNLREVRPLGRFAIHLDELWCEWGNYKDYTYHAP